ncbi:sugar-binding transcriptional regulator [Aureimonas fodinaquatilis]|uniref:Sugar-binding transcriptional regulator n=1 Tax=Aureimonas fodinaquatilis TaxID=2565783 RepID=A0A5B0E0I1_9HYPH|nr:sugar-binding transcriptional regulator [Aureimonas fodinaquatilis]KAA0971625.1 sugar-binding transcriptional regulator [Aureimonas fodinaquatilis]
MAKARQDDEQRLDDAARAGWLYYVAGKTQDEIARILGISRQSAQRLVSLSVSAGLVKVRIDHPIAACLDLAASLQRKFSLSFAQVVPSDPSSNSTTLGIALAGAAELERRLKIAEPQIIAMGTGRSLKAAVEHLPQMHCPQHRIVSLTGNITLDGSASVYNVIFSMADAVEAPLFPMPLPVVVSSSQERALLHEQKVVQRTLSLAAEANVTFVGIGEISSDAPLVKDRFVSPEECVELLRLGAVGEIVGWAFDQSGRILDCPFNDRVASAPLPNTKQSEVIAMAMGDTKLAAIRAALEGRLISGLVTDERTASHLLQGA